MQLTVTTDYAIRTLLCLNEKGNRLTTDEISQTMAIPDRYLLKVLKRLKSAGMVCSYPGNTGGYELCRELSDIPFWDILVTMEETMKINPCLDNEGVCSRKATKSCPVRRFYCALQTEMENRLRAITMEEIKNM